ncbi:MAG: GNAT family N-acetyltransferase [Steroidobacteraceae bacterium]
MTITCLWRSEFSNDAVNRLHAEAFGHRLFQDDWWGWVCAHAGEDLVGFVNVAWDGALHAFILDTMVAANYQRQGIASEMLAICTREARSARCEWLHVDFEEHLRPLYFDRAGFAPTNAGLIRL